MIDIGPDPNPHVFRGTRHTGSSSCCLSFLPCQHRFGTTIILSWTSLNSIPTSPLSLICIINPSPHHLHHLSQTNHSFVSKISKFKLSWYILPWKATYKREIEALRALHKSPKQKIPLSVDFLIRNLKLKTKSQEEEIRRLREVMNSGDPLNR